MNKKIIFSSIVLVFSLFSACLSTQPKKLQIEQIPTKQPVIIGSYKHEILTYISYPFSFSYVNDKTNKNWDDDARYYSHRDIPSGIIRYVETKDELIYPHGTRAPFLPKGNVFYYAKQYIRSIKNIQEKLGEYLNEMKKKQQDTIHVSKAEFDKKHFDIVREIYEGDTINIFILNPDRNKEPIFDTFMVIKLNDIDMKTSSKKKK